MFKIPCSTPFIKDALGPRRLSQIWKIWYVLICLSTLVSRIQVTQGINVTWCLICRMFNSYVLNSSYGGPVSQKLIKITYQIGKLLWTTFDISIKVTYKKGYYIGPAQSKLK